MNYTIDYKKVSGWGIDADPENDPTYPMSNQKSDGAPELGEQYKEPKQQPVIMETLISNERENMPAVFGQTIPPSLCSGAIRRYAFKFSENKYRHWLPLIIADRVQMVEGIFDDFKNGVCPNVFKERGWGAMWKHDRKNAIKKIAIGTLVTVAIIRLLKKRF